MRLCAFSLLFIVMSGCSGAATTPVVAARSATAIPNGHASHSGFSIDGTLYIVELDQVDPSVIGAVQAYTGHKPRLLGTIAGLASGITTPYAIAPDRNGNIFVANGFGDSSCDTCTITEYAKQQYGDVAPLRTIGNVGPVNALYIDRHENIYTAGEAIGSLAGNNAVYHDVNGTYQRTRQLERRRLANGIALDASGRIYLSTSRNGYHGNGAIEVFSAGTHGSARPIGTITGPKTAIFSPSGLAFDQTSNLYVAQVAHASITVYPAGSTNGNIAPLRTIAGPDTTIQYPTALSFDRHGNLYVDDAGRVLVFAPGAGGDAPPIATLSAPALQHWAVAMTVFPQGTQSHY
ncbi:MAG TPA: hypothetical protein VGF98_02145 [Candidatus Tumulicola sp.]|jgi:hypothetical protein